MIGDADAQTNALDVHLFLMNSLLLEFFLCLILELSHVAKPRHRRIRVGEHFYQIISALKCYLERFARLHSAELGSLFVNDKKSGRYNLLVDAVVDEGLL